MSCCLAVTALKEIVEKIAEIQEHADLLVRLICVLPGWSEKNVQVKKAELVWCHCKQSINLQSWICLLELLHQETSSKLTCYGPIVAVFGEQVQQRAIEIVTYIAQKSVFSKRSVNLCVAG